MPDRSAVTTTTTTTGKTTVAVVLAKKSPPPRMMIAAATRSYAPLAAATRSSSASAMVYRPRGRDDEVRLGLGQGKMDRAERGYVQVEHFDMSAKNRDDTNDRVLKDVVSAGFKLKAIFKEPTITIRRRIK